MALLQLLDTVHCERNEETELRVKHKHYEVLTQWLADQTLELEYLSIGAGARWYPRGDLNPVTHPDIEWRIKPRMVKVGRHEWPMPLEVATLVGTVYWWPSSGYTFTDTWSNNSPTDRARLSARMIHLTKEAAQQHADALVAINRGDVE